MGGITEHGFDYIIAGVIGVWVGLIIARFATWLHHRKKARTAVNTRSCPQCYAYAGYWCHGLNGKRIHDGRRL